MTLYEFALIAAVMMSFAIIRFGVPILVMWVFGHLTGALARPSS
jgi:NhaP-type Na+/H+ and K+/H+ antiporter